MNLVVIIIDTLRYDHIAANGKPDLHTPNLDRLTEKAWTFDRAFSASFPTIPHRTDVITGRYGAPFHPWKCLDFAVPTIPRVLASHGYCSQLIHDTPHLVNGGHAFEYPFDAWMPIRGAEVDRAWITDSWEYFDHWKHDPLFDHMQMTPEEVLRKNHALCCYVQTNHGRQSEDEWNTPKLFRTAARFLHDNKSRDNFFLWIDCFDPHEPWDAPPDLMKLYDDTPGYDGSIDPRAFHIHNAADLSEAQKKRIHAMYQAKVSLVDRSLGVFLDALEDTRLDQNTTVLLTADHGTNVGDRNQRFGKMGPPHWTEAHVPFIVSAPGMGNGRSNALVQPQDVFATLLACAGLANLPDGSESFDVLGGKDNRDIALAGSAVGGWASQGAGSVLFSAFDQDWRLGFAANLESCELQKLGTFENVAEANPEVVQRLYAAALAEIERRGLDPALVEWLKSEGKGACPTHYQVTDAAPPPKGWRGGYWNNLVSAIGWPRG